MALLRSNSGGDNPQLFGLQALQTKLRSQGILNPPPLVPGANFNDQIGLSSFGESGHVLTGGIGNMSRFEEGHNLMHGGKAWEDRYERQQQTRDSLEGESFFGRPLLRREEREHTGGVYQEKRELMDLNRQYRKDRDTLEQDIGRQYTGQDARRDKERSSRWERVSDISHSREKDRSNSQEDWNEHLAQNLSLMQKQLGQAAVAMGLGMNPAMTSNMLANMATPSMLPALSLGLLGGNPANLGIGGATGMGGAAPGTLGGTGIGVGGLMGSGFGAGSWQGMDSEEGSSSIGGSISTYVRPNCRLEPPPPDLPVSKHKEKPEGCKTIFIGGLTESVTESILNEVFYVCGEVITIRLSKKKDSSKRFCHIRFRGTDAVDRAINFSGYRLYFAGAGPNGIENCRIFVDYADSREDEQDLEREKRAKAREERHRAKEDAEALARLEAVHEKPVNLFSDAAASELLHNIRTDEATFYQSFDVLTQWLERGECSRKSVPTFYALLNAIHSHIKRLVKEKKENEEIVQRQRKEQLERATKVRDQGETILKVFKAASQKKCWDHFSKAQRRNIAEWQKQVMEETKLAEEEEKENRQEVGMDLESDDESHDAQVEIKQPPVPASAAEQQKQQGAKNEGNGVLDAEDAKLRAQAAGLKALAEKNSSLMWELEACKNEMMSLKQKFAAIFDEKDMQIARVTLALQGLQQYVQNTATSQPQMSAGNIEVVVTKDESQDEIETVNMELEGGESEPLDKSTCPVVQEPQEHAGDALRESEDPATDSSAASKEQATGTLLEPVSVKKKEGAPVEEETKTKGRATRKRGRKGKDQAVEEVPSTVKAAEPADASESSSKRPRRGRSARRKDDEEEKQKEEEKEQETVVAAMQDEEGEDDDIVVERAEKEEEEAFDMEGFHVCDEIGPEDESAETSEKGNQAEQLTETQPDQTHKTAIDSTEGETQQGQAPGKIPLELVRLSEQEMALVGVLCSYLAASPSGATGSQISMHVQRHVPTADLNTVDKILRSLPMLFQESQEFVGQTWKFSGFSVNKQTDQSWS